MENTESPIAPELVHRFHIDKSFRDASKEIDEIHALLIKERMAHAETKNKLGELERKLSPNEDNI